MLVLAHISDPHLHGSARATGRAERVRDRLRELPGRVDAPQRCWTAGPRSPG